MFERFLSSFKVTSGPSVIASNATASASDWIDIAGGRAFEGGLYRVHTKADASRADDLVRAAFPEYEGRFACFGRDWLGRQFATDSSRGSESDPEVLLFEPGTGQALQIPVGFSWFHDGELVDSSEAALAPTFFEQWLAVGGAAPSQSECIGYKTPLFLGGRDETENLELSDLDVYWTIMGQLRLQAIGKPTGTRVLGVSLEP